MRLVTIAIALAIIAAACDYFFGIEEPWRKIIFAGIVILFIIGIILLLVPGLLPIVDNQPFLERGVSGPAPTALSASSVAHL